MDAPTKDKLFEFQSIVSKMSLEVCHMTVLPELGVSWKDVRQVVRNTHLPMTPLNVAKVLRHHIAKTLSGDQLDEIIAQLRIKSVASSGARTWHAVTLLDPTGTEPAPATWARRVLQAARTTVREHNTHVVVHTCNIGDFIFMSVQKVSDIRSGTPIYVAAVPGRNVIFLTTLSSTGLIRAIVEGLGYSKCESAELYGRDLPSLLRIVEQSSNVDVNFLTEPTEYRPEPVITKNCIDYTNKTYNQRYVDELLGPNPPLLNNLDIKCSKPFFDSSRYNKMMTVCLTLKSEDVIESLKGCIAARAVSANSNLLTALRTATSNTLTYDD